jgi:hypothetical protein
VEDEDEKHGLILSVGVERAIRFLAGLGLLIYEAAFYPGAARPVLVVLYGGMMGLSLANVADDVRQSLKGGRR